MALSKWNIAIMALCTGLIVANIYYSQPLMVLMGEEFHVSESNAGQVTFFTQVGYALGLLFCVPLGDMLEKRKQIVIMTLASAGALVVSALSQSIGMLKAAGLLIGFTSVVPQLILPLAATLSTNENRGKVIGIVTSGLLIGILLSRTLSGIVGHHFGWRAMFWIAAGISVSLAVLMFFSFPKSQPTFKGHYGDLMRSLLTLIREQPVLREAAAINACCFGMFGLFWTTVVFLLSEAPFHYGSDKIGMMGLAAAAGALGAPLVGRIADKKNPRIAVGYGICFLFLGYFLFYIFSANIIGIIAGIIAIDLGVQAIHVSNQTRVYSLIPSARNRLNTVYMTASFIGTSLGSGIGLWVWAAGGWTGVCIAGTCLISIAAIIYLFTYNKR
ncbi:Predicted arabinose efflux permease, MFS family [Chitinophaga jiangningensis]|uniref:Predicted arabinose efflux permease, MFS family n=1 Tax=Chitinophaga jiangningensis TaxID=1419482 RepID=A0A1M7CSL2_9BACT|nr:MFS transporter [Chitinophaga jiangningensis]SHL70308.1 Predicted arabinose efflux permease, MFS family [Chitinophaga jiangningensis]